MNMLRVGVLMGGKSIEREVSFNSGRTICDHLDSNRYEILPLFQRHTGQLYLLPAHFLHRGKISDFEHRLDQEATRLSWDQLKQLVDFIYIATHGEYAEDGTLQGLLEIFEIPYLGSGVLASALGMDKKMQKEFLTAAGICVAKGITLNESHITNSSIEEIVNLLKQNELQFPLIVKPNHEGSSLGVSAVFKIEQLHDALIAAMTANALHNQSVLVEEKIEGMEFSCVTLFDHKTGQWLPLLPTEVEHQPNTHFFDYEQKYMPGRAIEHTPARCSQENLQKIQDACVATTKALGMRTISRIDGFLQKDGTVIIVDPNTLSGMAPASFLFREAAHSNMNHPQLINYLIETELAQYGLLPATTTNKAEEQSTMEPKKRIAVLFGGASNEKEISLESGRNVVYKLHATRYEVLPLFVSSTFELFKIDQKLLVRSSTVEIESLVSPENKIAWNDLPAHADFVFIALHGGKGENGCVQGALEMLGLPYNGSSVLASALCMDKYKTTQFLHHKGFSVPRSKLISKQEWLDEASAVKKNCSETIALPWIVKPHDDGCSVMVQKIKTVDELDTAVQLLFSNNKEYALIEECISGMELTVGVLGNDKPRALVPSQAVTAKDILSMQEKFLPGAGENQTPAPLAQATLSLVQRTIEKAYEALGCKGYARIDCFYQNAQQSPTQQERVVILEVNTLPALTPATCIFHQAAELGIKPKEFIETIIALGLEAHQSKLVTQSTTHTEIQSY